MDSTIKPLEETREHPGGDSTDVGDVSWNVVNINLGVTTAPKDTVACGGMSIGHKGMLYASKTMSMSDLFEKAELVEKVKAEYKERKGDEVYKAIIPKGLPPINGN